MTLGATKRTHMLSLLRICGNNYYYKWSFYMHAYICALIMTEKVYYYGAPVKKWMRMCFLPSAKRIQMQTLQLHAESEHYRYGVSVNNNVRLQNLQEDLAATSKFCNIKIRNPLISSSMISRWKLLCRGIVTARNKFTWALEIPVFLRFWICYITLAFFHWILMIQFRQADKIFGIW